MAGFLDTSSSHSKPGYGKSKVLVVQNDDAITELEKLTQIDVEHLSGVDVDISKHYIKGLISTVYATFETKIRKTKKLVLESCNSQQSSSTEKTHSLSVFMIGEDVDKCDILKCGDLIIMKGFSFEKKDAAGQNVQIVVNLQDSETKIWVVKCKDLSSKDKQAKGTGVSKLKRRPRNFELDVDKELQRSASNEATSKEKTSNAPNELQKVLVAGGKKLQVIQKPQKLPYTKLATLKAITNEHKLVNVFAVVKYFKSPKKSKGKDYCMAISLVDDSSASEESFVCTVFAPSTEQLPAIKHVGDIVRFEGINASRFNGTVNGIANSRHTFKWLVFNGSVDASIIPTASYPSSSSSSSALKSHTLCEEEQKMIQNLKTWASLNVKVPPKKNLSQISPENLFFDISCQVVSVCMATNASCMVLTVWDGTFPQCQSSPVAEVQKGESNVSDDVSLKRIPKGLTIDIHLYDEHSNLEMAPGDFVTLVNVHAISPYPQAGDTNKITFILHKGTINGRGVRKLSHDSQEMKEVQEQIASYKRNQMEEAAEEQNVNKTENRATILPRTLQTSCTITDFPSIAFSSIEALKHCSKVSNKFRCRVKAMAFLPQDVKDFVQRCCSCCKTLSQVNSSTTKNSQEATTEVSGKENKGKSNEENQKTALVLSRNGEATSSQGCDVETTEKSKLKTVDSDYKVTSPKCSVCHQETHLVYVFSLLIEDPSGILHVMLFDSDVKAFLSDLPTPEEFLTSPEAQTMVRESLVSITDNQTNELTAESQPEGGRPWMECCVMSYMNDQRVYYRMFGTTLI